MTPPCTSFNKYPSVLCDINIFLTLPIIVGNTTEGLKHPPTNNFQLVLPVYFNIKHAAVAEDFKFSIASKVEKIEIFGYSEKCYFYKSVNQQKFV